MSKHFMVDIETLGTRGNCIVTSIGIAKFDKHEVLDAMQVHVNADEQLQNDRTLTVDTVLWWMGQSDSARQMLKAGQASSKTVSETLNSIAAFMGQDTKESPNFVWGNGAAFDNAKLEDMYTQYGIPAPWKFWNDRCYRTVKSVHKNINIKREGVHHNAVDDARFQAKHLIEINKQHPHYL